LGIGVIQNGSQHLGDSPTLTKSLFADTYSLGGVPVEFNEYVGM
jgi:hypothetical protein